VVGRGVGARYPSAGISNVGPAFCLQYETWKAGAAKEETMKCMGIFRNRWLNQKDNARDRASASEWWVDILEDRSETHVITSSRCACGESIVSSGLLGLLLAESNTNMSNNLTNIKGIDGMKDNLVRVWLVALRLLEDEDEGTRTIVARHL